MKIANIITQQGIKVSEEFNVVDSMDKIIHGLPTLIVGFDYVNKHYPDFDILNREVEKNLYWIFKRTEKRDDYNEGLEWFIKKVFNDLFIDVNYVFVDPIQYNKKKLIKIIKKFYSLKNKITLQNEQMLYIYGEKLILGVDLKLLKYLGVDFKGIRDKIIKKSSVFLDDEGILIEYKKIVDNFDEKVRYIPYLFSITHEQNNPTSIIHIPRES